MGSLDGRCLCGSATYTCDADPLMTLVCHCTDCRRQSGGVASIIAAVPRPSFEMHGDTLAMYETTGTDSGARRERWFCSTCGSPLATLMDDLPDLVAIKAGTLDRVDELEPQGEIWCESALAWWPESEQRQRFARGPALA